MKLKISGLFQVISIGVLSFTISGCSTVLNPFDSSFACQGITSNGKCTSVTNAYKESVNNGESQQQQQEKPAVNNGNDGDLVIVSQRQEGEYLISNGVTKHSNKTDNALSYRESQMSKITKLLTKPNTPVIVPPSVIRVLILPYQGDDDELLMPRYAYFMLDKPKWVVGDYLINQQGTDKEEL